MIRIKNQNGSALLQALIYSALLATVIITALTFYSNQTQVAKSQLKFSTRDELRNSISSYIQIPEALHKSLMNTTCVNGIQTAQAAGNQKDNNLISCLPHSMGATAYSATSDPLYPQDGGWIPFSLHSPIVTGVGTNLVAGTKANPIYYDELGNRCANANCPFRAYTMYRFLIAGVSGEPSVEVKFRLEPVNNNAETTVKAKAYEATNQISLYQINKRGNPARVDLCTDSAGVVIPGMIRIGLVGDTSSATLQSDICVPAIGTEVCPPNQFQSGVRADGSPVCTGQKTSCPSGYILVGMQNGATGVTPACMDSRCHIKNVSGVGRFGFVSPDNLSNATNGVSCIVIRPHANCEAPGLSNIKNSIDDQGQLLCDTTVGPPPVCPNPMPTPEVQTISCPAPFAGTITQERTYNCPPAPGSWGSYVDIASTCTVGIVNGTCGAAHLSVTPVAPTANLCTAGTASALTGIGPWSWTCQGSGAGADENCIAGPAVININGVCGPSNGLNLIAAPTNNFCATGSASPVTGTGPWNWTCVGSGPTGTTVNCSANIDACGIHSTLASCEALHGAGNCIQHGIRDNIAPAAWAPAVVNVALSCPAIFNSACIINASPLNDSAPCCTVATPCTTTSGAICTSLGWKAATCPAPTPAPTPAPVLPKICPVAQEIIAPRLGSGPGCEAHGISKVPSIIPAGLTIDMGNCTSTIVSNLSPGQYCVETTEWLVPSCTETQFVGCLPPPAPPTPTPAPTATPAPTPTPVPIPGCGTWEITFESMSDNFSGGGSDADLNKRCNTLASAASKRRIFGPGGAANDGIEYRCEEDGYACSSNYNATTPASSIPAPGKWAIAVSTTNHDGAINYFFPCGNPLSEPTAGAACTIHPNNSGINNTGYSGGNSYVICHTGPEELRVWKCVP